MFRLSRAAKRFAPGMNEPSELATPVSRPLCIEGRAIAIAIATGYDKIPQEPSAVTFDYTHNGEVKGLI